MKCCIYKTSGSSNNSVNIEHVESTRNCNSTSGNKKNACKFHYIFTTYLLYFVLTLNFLMLYLYKYVVLTTHINHFNRNSSYAIYTRIFCQTCAVTVHVWILGLEHIDTIRCTAVHMSETAEKTPERYQIRLC